ncbi:MAG: ATP-binding cassette domain-containing protein, partial [Pseudomonadota bacterium]
AFDLAPLAERPAGSLSAGQKRRLGLARLPLTRARLWLLDEPTVALDTGAVAALLALLQGHLAGGGIALVSTHQTLALDADTLTLAPPSEDAHAADPFLEGFET